MKIYNVVSIPKGLQEVECNCQEEYFSGYTAGYEDGKNKGFQSGYTSGVTDGIEEGKEEQKSLMVYTAITENGTYSREDGYNEIFVDVPSYSAETYASGYTDGYESGYTDGSENGFESGYTSGYTDGTEDGFGSGFTSGYTEGYSSGYTDGLNASGQSYESGYTSGYTDGYESGYTQGTDDGFGSGYTSGKTDGYESGYTSGKTDGVAEQKSKLVSTAITANGTYQKEDGYNTITVNVPTGSTINNQTKFVRLYDNGSSAITFDAGYTGLEKVDVEVEVPVMEYWESGYTEGLNYGRTIGYASGYTSGKTDGVAEQKAKLVSTAVTLNGTYSREDGYSSITVNVSSGATINNQTKSITATTNGSSVITYDAGYTGLERVNVNVNVPTQDYWNQGFASGYTIGTADGVAEQKAKLTSTAFTQNGTYTRADGWSAVTVNVSGYTQQDLDNAFNSGWTNGYNSGYTDGYNDASGQTTGAPLTFEALSAGTLYWWASVSSFTRTIYWSKNDGQTWHSVTSSNESSGAVITTVQAGDKILFKGDNDYYCGQASGLMGTTRFKSDFPFDVYGNINSLLNSTAFTEIYDYVYGHTFCYLFSETNIKSAKHLIMQATGITEHSYDSMFDNCQLTEAPEILPATSLGDSCYLWMFYNCKSLTTAPQLPATNLVKSCYSGMFYGCTSLTIAPVLPATTLVQSCYVNMFGGCTNLNYIKCLATDITAQGCTNNWVSRVQTNNGIFVKPSTTDWSSKTGDSGIPANWTVQNA